MLLLSLPVSGLMNRPLVVRWTARVNEVGAVFNDIELLHAPVAGQSATW
jgi:hypothetical protein